MMEFLFFFIMIAVLGFVTGVGVLIHKETTWYRNFMQNRPVIGWTSTFIAGGTAWFVASFIVLFAILLMFSFLTGQRPPQWQ